VRENVAVPFIEGVSGRVHYRTWPVESPRAALVFLHGIRQSSSDYHRFGRALTRSGIEVWAIDHTGHGLSEGEQGAVPVLADLGENAQRLLGLAAASGLPAILMGHSLGAAVALTALRTPAATPVDGLVLCGTPKGVTASGTAVPRLPILAVHGADDRLAPVDSVRSWVAQHPHVELREYPDAGHDLLHEPVQATVTTDVVRWILDRSDVASTGPG
jgi:alpha-beta hydrolase superfamily lysophospholipase